ncbi:MAG: PIN domain-containing protein [Armatimonadota bacterium]
MKRKVAFLDTNVFLHYQAFDHIPWLSVLDSSSALIVVPWVVIEELDKQKDEHARRKIRERARRALSKLTEVGRKGGAVELQPCVDILVELQPPALDFQKHGLDPLRADDQLFASMIAFRHTHPDCDLVLVAHDVTNQLRALRHDIAAVEPPADLKLQEELDANEKRTKELEQRVRELESRLPVLELGFPHGSNHKRFALARPPPPPHKEIEKKIAELKEQHPKLQSPRVTLGIPILAAMSPRQVRHCNAQLDQFYADYAEYLEQEWWFRHRHLWTIRLDTKLTNSGTCPAEDVHVFLRFPKGVHVYDEAEHREPSYAPEPPQPPQPPMTITESARRQVASVLHPVSSAWPARLFPRVSHDVSGPLIDRDSGEVQFTRGTLNHGLTMEFDPLYVRFESWDSAFSFELPYTIHAANLPSPTEGSLHVVVERDTDVGGEPGDDPSRSSGGQGTSAPSA